ncbi:MAG: hypothetical protein IH805_02510 [Proteobacteria bacterium]|nr:hypothetical protein [Pseudomonadota bacterium]
MLNQKAGRPAVGCARRLGEMKRLAAASAPRCGFATAHPSNPSIRRSPTPLSPDTTTQAPCQMSQFRHDRL